MGIERELKLVPLDRRWSWSDVEALLERAGARWTTTLTDDELRAIYFDPATLPPRASLRARLERGRWIATAKMPGGRVGDRVEVDAEVEGPPAEGDALPLGLAAVLQRRTWPALLFETAIRRSSRRAVDAEGHPVEVVFDVGAVAAKGRTSAVREVEIEDLSPERGDGSAVARLALACGELGGVRPALLSKAERGLLLLGRITDDRSDVGIAAEIRAVDEQEALGAATSVDPRTASRWWASRAEEWGLSG